MQELIVNKTFETRQELEQYEQYLTENYIVFMIMRKEQVIGEPEIYGIDKVMHFGVRA